MATLDLITKQDLEQFKTELFAELKKLGISPATEQSGKQWLKSAEVRKLLKISAGTLQNLRINGTLSYTTVGSILYYKYGDILKILESNTIKTKAMKLAAQADRFLRRAANDDRLLPSHISLYMAMFYYSPAENPEAHFQVSRKKLMRFSRIKSVATYHKCIEELVSYGYIDYQPSYYPYRASKVLLLK